MGRLDRLNKKVNGYENDYETAPGADSKTLPRQKAPHIRRKEEQLTKEELKNINHDITKMELTIEENTYGFRETWTFWAIDVTYLVAVMSNSGVGEGFMAFSSLVGFSFTFVMFFVWCYKTHQYNSSIMDPGCWHKSYGTPIMTFAFSALYLKGTIGGFGAMTGWSHANSFWQQHLGCVIIASISVVSPFAILLVKRYCCKPSSYPDA